MKMPGLDHPGKFNGMARALHVDQDLTRFIGLQVINGSQMVKMIDLPLELSDQIARHTKLVAGQVTRHRDDTRSAGAPEFTQGFDLARAVFRIRKYTTEPLRSSNFRTSRLPMKPVAPVTK